jgi:hypothetical protein
MSTAQDLYEPTGPRLASYRIIESLETRLAAAELAGLKQRLGAAVRYFPELNDTTVTVAWKPEDHSWYAEADWENDIIYLPAHEPCPAVTIFHELGHLTIYRLDERGADVPVTSEEFCSIFSVARMPPSAIDRDHIAYLGEPSVPREEWPEICQRALEYRTDNHDYIKQCTEWLEI